MDTYQECFNHIALSIIDKVAEVERVRSLEQVPAMESPTFVHPALTRYS